jgi:predicted TIM-barrel fold metal-dependent hydrolase
LKELAVDFPDVKIQLAHYGTPRLQDRGDPARTIHYDRLKEPIELMRAHPNLRCDLSACHHIIPKNEPFPFWSALRVLKILVDELGAERIHWGTDWPYLREQPYSELVRAIREAPFLKDGEAEKILGLNALQFLQA